MSSTQLFHYILTPDKKRQMRGGEQAGTNAKARQREAGHITNTTYLIYAASGAQGISRPGPWKVMLARFWTRG